jgi:hypothetical protein
MVVRLPFVMARWFGSVPAAMLTLHARGRSFKILAVVSVVPSKLLVLLVFITRLNQCLPRVCGRRMR